MNQFNIFVAKGYLKTDEGLKYLQEAINKEIEFSGLFITLIKYEDVVNPEVNEVMTKITIMTNGNNIEGFKEAITGTFNRRKRWIKNK